LAGKDQQQINQPYNQAGGLPYVNLNLAKISEKGTRLYKGYIKGPSVKKCNGEQAHKK